MLYLEVQINESDVAPLLIFRKDNVEGRLEDFSNQYSLNFKKRQHLRATVIEKLAQLQGFIPERRELSSKELLKGTAAGVGGLD